MLKIYKHSKNIYLAAILVVGVFLLLISSAHTLAAITRGYSTDDEGIRPGMVVALSENSTPENPKVERASPGLVERVIGVATTIEDSLVTISSGEKASYVESDGEIDAFVVNLDGEVGQGDLLALSPLKGILTKALPPQPVVAIALEGFSGEGAETYEIQDGSRSREVLIKRIKVNLDRKAFANLAEVDDDSVLSKLGRAIIGKDVGEIQVVIALIIFFMVLVAEGTILYGAISSAISSLGRNPLAKNIIRHELVRVLFIALAVLAFGIAAIYAILWV